MRPSDVVRRGSDYLERHGVESPRQTAEVLMAHVLGTDRVGLYSRNEGLSSREARMFGRAICQRCAGTPLQHLTGEQKFRRVALEVRPGVFVPRPETEILVEVSLKSLGKIEGPVVIDVGTGTGAMALAIKDERPDAKVFATDLSSEAVELARGNAARLGLEVRIEEGAFLDPVPDDLRGWVDLLVSNPPYVTRQEYEDLPLEVRSEPELALIGGVELHRRLAEDGTRWLRDGGALAVEIGEGQGDEVITIFSDLLYMDVRLERDLAGRDRVVVGRRP